jgi:hypothetical protein
MRANRSKKSGKPTTEQGPRHPEWTPVVLEELAACVWCADGDGDVWRYDREGLPARFRARVKERLGADFDIRLSDDTIRQAHDIAKWLGGTLGLPMPPAHELIPRVAALVADNGGVEAKRRAMLSYVEEAIGRWKSGDHAGAAETLGCFLLVLGLKLPPAIVRRELSRCTVRQAPRISAALAVAANWLGDTDETKSRKSFLAAASGVSS